MVIALTSNLATEYFWVYTFDTK